MKNQPKFNRKTVIFCIVEKKKLRHPLDFWRHPKVSRHTVWKSLKYQIAYRKIIRSYYTWNFWNFAPFKYELAENFDSVSYLAEFGTFAVSVARRLLLEAGRDEMCFQEGIFRQYDVQNQSGGKIWNFAHSCIWFGDHSQGCECNISVQIEKNTISC